MLTHLGAVHAKLRDYTSALAIYEQALTLTRHLGDRIHESELLWVRAYLCIWFPWGNTDWTSAIFGPRVTQGRKPLHKIATCVNRLARVFSNGDVRSEVGRQLWGLRIEVRVELDV